MDIVRTVESFKGTERLAGLDNAWRWEPALRLYFSGALSGDGDRLLQLRVQKAFDEELTLAALTFARAHEAEAGAVKPHWAAVPGFVPPVGRHYDSVAVVGPEVHEFYRVEKKELMPLVRLVLPAYQCEFSAGGTETLPEAITRYRTISMEAAADRAPEPYLRMLYINTRTRGRSVGKERGFTTPEVLNRELAQMGGGEGSLVEFEDRQAQVWRVRWFEGSWFLADWTHRDGEPQQIALDDLLAFAQDRLASTAPR